MNGSIPPITESNVSLAWSKAFLAVMERGVQEIGPLVIQVNNLDSDQPLESAEIRESLDQCTSSLRKKHTKLQPVHTVANTIFPQSLWNPEKEAARLYIRFNQAWPRLKKCTQNRRGSYFFRMTNFRGVENDKPINQLDHIVSTYNSGNHRRSALIATIFDPALDHKNSPQLGFPCLQQVSFVPVENNGLVVTGNYTTQYLFDRAYGNYLGLCRLGKFMAQQMGRTLVQMNCITLIGQRGTPTKSELQPLVSQLQSHVANVEGTAA